MNKIELCKFSELEDRQPRHAMVNDLDLVIIRYDNQVSVLYGRCLHRGAMMADGRVEGENLICGVHGWDYRYHTGVSEYNNKEVLHKFSTLIERDMLYVDLNEIEAFLKENPPSFNREACLGSFADTHPEETEPYTGYISELAKNGLKNIGHHIFTEAMGVDRTTLPRWEEIQFLPAQLARARKHLDQTGNSDVSLIITGGLRIADDFVKALMLNADAVAISNSALQAIGCLGMRACGYENMNQFNKEDLVTFDHDMHLLTGIAYAGRMA